MQLSAPMSIGLTVALAPSLLAQDAPDDPLYQELQRFGSKTTRAGSLPGMAVACIRDGKVAWTLCCGYADLEEKTRVTPERDGAR